MLRTLRRRAIMVTAALGIFLPALIEASAAGANASNVVINEILYHPPDDRDDLQFVELHNAGTNTADVSGWRLTNGVQFTFPRQTILPADGYALVCSDMAAFKAYFGPRAPLAGAFTGRLKHTHQRLELVDASGHVADRVEYADHAPWPLTADGYGASLERICPRAPGDDPQNWAASEVKPDGRILGTPGARNSCFSTLPLPRVVEVSHGQAAPDKPLSVTATVAHEACVKSVTLLWAAWTGEAPMTWAELAMQRQDGDERRGIYGASIPAQPEGRVIRFTIHARGADGAERVAPSPTDLRSTFSATTFVNTNTARVPFFVLLSPSGIRPGQLGGERPARRSRLLTAVGEELAAEPVTSWESAAIVMTPGDKEIRLYDHIHVRPRRGGLKVHFHKDQPYGDITSVDLLFKGPPRWALSEALAQELYRRVGVMAPETQHVRLWIGSRFFGYYLLIEQPNKSLLRRNGRDPDGNLYKITWYGNGLIGQHEKQTRPHSGHDDLVKVVEGLNHTSGVAQWDFIQQNFNVDAMIDEYAVNMCIQDWDGYWNNYFAYHDLRPGGKWEVIPWDKDKTWGDYDGVSPQYDWYDMPLTFGMSGAKPVRNSMFDFGPFGGVMWWRPPGYFSGPLLANPEFRRRFLARLREICETVFTPEKMEPMIHAVETRLEEEVQVRTRLTGQDPAVALREFKDHIQSFRNQVVHRQQFILDHLEAKPNAK